MAKNQLLRPLNFRQFQPFDFHFQQDLIFRGEISVQIKSEFNFQMISGAKIWKDLG